MAQSVNNGPVTEEILHAAAKEAKDGVMGPFRVYLRLQGIAVAYNSNDHRPQITVGS